MNNETQYPRSDDIERNKKEYPDCYDAIRWISPKEAVAAHLEREQLLLRMRGGTKILCQGTKICYGLRSPGCLCCADGTWSCLFVNGTCSGACFFCPAEQNGPDIAQTNNIPFLNPGDYIDYLDRLGMKGVGISGGDPLRGSSKTVEYLRLIKERFGPAFFTWLYTNGNLLTQDLLQQFKAAGLDEMRFNIAATHYSLEKIPDAVRTIPYVTVEIPAIPEDYELMKLKMVDMARCGVQFLNLHQLRLTPFNAKRLLQRNYTFLHGEKVTVLESELTALRLVAYASEKKLPISVNYCSFVYKNRFSRLGARRRGALLIKKSFEHITGNGYLRYFFISGATTQLFHAYARLSLAGVPPELFQIKDNRLYFSESLLMNIDPGLGKLSVGYCEARILPELSYYFPFEEIPLNPSKKIVVERMRVSKEIEIFPEEIPLFHKLISGRGIQTGSVKLNEKWQNILSWEYMRQGFQSYY